MYVCPLLMRFLAALSSSRSLVVVTVVKVVTVVTVLTVLTILIVVTVVTVVTKKCRYKFNVNVLPTTDVPSNVTVGSFFL